MKTNRALYKGIVELAEKNKEYDLSLEDYLTRILRLAYSHKEKISINCCTIYSILSEAFTSEAESLKTVIGLSENDSGFRGWEATIRRQILDLQGLKQIGGLENEYRYLGIDSPSGQRWFNFDPCTYIECGAAGSFDGWEEGDNSERQHVPGKVAALNQEGEMIICDPQEIEHPIVSLDCVTWDEFQDFLWCGQHYE